MVSFPKPKARSRKAKAESLARPFRNSAWRKHGQGIRGQEHAPCARCGREVWRGVDGEIDHIKPRSTHPELRYDVENTRVTCHECNRYLKTHPLERHL